MKKIILIAIFSLFASSSLFAQSLELVSYDDVVTGDPSEELNSFAVVKNISNESKKIMIRIITQQAAEGHEIAMCWGQCFFVTESDITFDPSKILDPGALSEEGYQGYHTSCTPYDYEGQSIVRIIFFVEGNPTDNVEYTVTFNATLSDISEEDFEENINIFPNPAQDVLTIENNNEAAQIADIYDNNGNIVIKGIRLNSLETVNTQMLPVGAYYLRLRENNVSKRIIIAR